MRQPRRTLALGVRRLSGQRLEQQAAERVDVGARVDALVDDLLGRHVLGARDDGPRTCQVAFRVGLLCEPEVAEVHVVAAREEDVGRLDIAMHQAAGVGGVERGADLVDDTRRSARFEVALRGDQGPEVRALDEPHHDEEHAVLVAGLEDGNDVLVVDRSREPGLAAEALAKARVARMLRANELEGHHALERELLGPVDDTHLSAADDALDTAPREDGAERQLGSHVLAVCHGPRP